MELHEIRDMEWHLGLQGQKRGGGGLCRKPPAMQARSRVQQTANCAWTAAWGPWPSYWGDRVRQLWQGFVACDAYDTMPHGLQRPFGPTSTLSSSPPQVAGNDAALTPRVVLAAPPEGLRAAGLSERKVAAMNGFVLCDIPGGLAIRALIGPDHTYQQMLSCCVASLLTVCDGNLWSTPGFVRSPFPTLSPCCKSRSCACLAQAAYS